MFLKCVDVQYAGTISTCQGQNNRGTSSSPLFLSATDHVTAADRDK